MGKVKTIVMGDEAAEAEAREKAAAKRAAKKAEKKAQEEAVEPSVEVKETVEVAQEEKEVKEEKKKVVTKKVADKYIFAKGKKYLLSAGQVDKTKFYPLTEAIKLAQKTSFSKFDGSIEIHMNVVDKGLRGVVALPHGNGKEVRVKIADEALIKALETSSKVDFDILVATPDMMPKLARVAKILGPKGLMPSPKTGTISATPEKLAKELSQGQLQWKTEAQTPIIHAVIGKVSFDSKQLEENMTALMKSIGKDKMRSLFIKATMGPAIKVSL